MSEPFLSEIRLVSFNYAPRGWAFCNGQFLAINQNQALFSLMGTTYGGNGQTTFALPDLRGRVAIHRGEGHTQGEAAGAATVTLNMQQLPQHIHFLQVRNATPGVVNGNVGAPTKFLAQALAIVGTGNQPVNMYGTGGPNQVMAPTSTQPIGGNQPHPNMMPYAVANYIIALEGIFPSQN